MLIAGGRSSVAWATTKALVRRRDTVLGTHSAIRGHDVGAAAKQLADELDADRVGMFGEVYGEGVQDLHYGDSAKAGVPGYACSTSRSSSAATNTG